MKRLSTAKMMRLILMTAASPLPSAYAGQCAPAHATTNGVPYVIADTLPVLIAAENIAVGYRSGFPAGLIAKHAGMGYEELLKDIEYQLSFKNDGALQNSFQIFHTAALTASSLRRYSKAQIIAEETRQHDAGVDTGARYLDTPWLSQYHDAITCNDSRRIADLLAIRFFLRPREGYLFPWW